MTYYVTSFEHFGGNTYSLRTWSTVAPKYENIPHCMQQVPILWPLADKGGIVYYQPYITEAILIFYHLTSSSEGKCLTAEVIAVFCHTGEMIC